MKSQSSPTLPTIDDRHVELCRRLGLDPASAAGRQVWISLAEVETTEAERCRRAVYRCLLGKVRFAVINAVVEAINDTASL